MDNKLEIINVVFSKFDFYLDIEEKTVSYNLTKNARCSFSADETLNRALVKMNYLSIADKETEERSFRFNVEAYVEIQLPMIPTDDEAERVIKTDILPLADKCVAEKIKQCMVTIGHSNFPTGS